MTQSIIAGCLTDSKTKTPLSGRKIVVVDDQTDEVLLETYSFKDGQYRVNVPMDLVSKGQRKLSVKAVDKQGKALGVIKSIRLQPWQEVMRDIKIDESNLPEGPLELPHIEKLSGTMIDPEAKQVVNQAVAMMAPPGSAEHARYMSMANCPLPPIEALGTLVQDAWDVIEGNPAITEHFRQSFNYIADIPEADLSRTSLKLYGGSNGSNSGCGCGGSADKADPGLVSLSPDLIGFKSEAKAMLHHATQAHGDPLPMPERRMSCVIPLDRFAPVVAASLSVARTLQEANLMVGAIQNGLCGIERFGHLVQTARMALESGDVTRFRGVLQRNGWECGPDDGPIPGNPRPRPEPQPEPMPRPGPCPPRPRVPSLEDCIPQYWDCIHEIADAFRNRISGRRKSYQIDTISPASGCPGQTITLTGQDFGTIAGKVCFTSAAGSKICTTAVLWSDTEIQVVVPNGVGEGDVSLQVAEESIRVCNRLIPLFRSGNKIPFAGGAADILWLRVNHNTQDVCIEPGDDAVISWAATAGSSVNVRVLYQGSAVFTRNNQPASGQVTFTTPNNVTAERTYRVIIDSSNICGSDTRTLDFTLTVIPRLTIEGIEITQGIQRFWRTGIVPNSLPVIAGKDTIARVYISCDRNGMNNNEFGLVTGTLEIGSTTLTPINGITPNSVTGNPFITARARADIDRSVTNHTLNFRIPANLSTGTQTLRVRVGGIHAPCGATIAATRSQSQTWQNNNALRVHYVRLRDNGPGGGGATPTDAQCTFTVNRGLDLFPTPATNIAAARTAIFATNRDFTNSDDELRGLLNDLDDEHNCSAWEAFWSLFGLADCPPADNAEWVGLSTRRHRGWATGGNTCLSAIYLEANGQGDIMRIKTAHELGHNVGFCHDSAGNAPGPCRNVGTSPDVPFDPHWNQTITGTVTDIMGYGATRYVHETSWNDLITNI